MHLNLIHKKIVLWLVLFFAFELAIACPVNQLVQHVGIISLFSDSSQNEYDQEEEELCIFCFNKNLLFFSTGNDYPILEPEIGFNHVYAAVELIKSNFSFTIRPPPEFLS